MQSGSLPSIPLTKSGSMYDNGGLPAAVAFSLGLCLAEHNKGRVRNRFIEFSDHPQLIPLKGKAFFDKLQYAMTFNEIISNHITSRIYFIFVRLFVLSF